MRTEERVGGVYKCERDSRRAQHGKLIKSSCINHGTFLHNLSLADAYVPLVPSWRSINRHRHKQQRCFDVLDSLSHLTLDWTAALSQFCLALNSQSQSLLLPLSLSQFPSVSDSVFALAWFWWQINSLVICFDVMCDLKLIEIVLFLLLLLLLWLTLARANNNGNNNNNNIHSGIH